MPPIAVLTWFFAHRVFPISRQVQERKGHLTEASDEAVVGIEMVQAFGREDDVRDRFGDRRRGRAERDDAPGDASRRASSPACSSCPRSASRPCSASAAATSIAGTLTIGEFTLFITLLLQLVWPLEALGWIINLGQRAIASASRSFAWLDGIEPLRRAGASRSHCRTGPLAVRFEDVHFSYRTGARGAVAASTSRSPRARSSPSAGRPGPARRRC